MDRFPRARLYRRKAKELREMAATFKSTATKAEILVIAFQWDCLAGIAEQTAMLLSVRPFPIN